MLYFFLALILIASYEDIKFVAPLFLPNAVGTPAHIYLCGIPTTALDGRNSGYQQGRESIPTAFARRNGGYQQGRRDEVYEDLMKNRTRVVDTKTNTIE